MNLFIVILLMNFVHLFGDKFGSRISKHQLRGMHKEYQEIFIQEKFKTTFDSLYKQIIEMAMMGKNEYQFTIMCYPLEYSSNENCEIRNIGERKEWTNDHPFIKKKQFITNVLDALQNSFPDSNFTKTYKNCCEHYSIEW